MEAELEPSVPMSLERGPATRTPATPAGPVAQLLDQAHDLLSRLELHKGGFYSFNTDGDLVAVDVQGALLESAPKGWRRALVWEGAVPYLRDVTGAGELASWNDDPRRTKADVLQALESAAERARRNGA